ncbi:MAG TPA: hypothetical protein VGM72_03305 [Micropepsaceae bacterium]|jgi:hypothetical protein
MRTKIIRHTRHGSCIASIAAAILAMSCMSASAAAQPSAVNAIPLEDDVVPAPNGYDATSAKYTVARPTDIYISPFIWGGKVKGVHFDAGQPVDILARPKGYDWFLVGKNGTGIGYVPMANVAPAKP